MYYPQSSIHMDSLSIPSSSRVADSETLMIALMYEQRDMEIETDDQSNLPAPSDTFEQAIPYHFDDVQDLPSPISKDICAALVSTSTPALRAGVRCRR